MHVPLVPGSPNDEDYVDDVDGDDGDDDDDIDDSDDGDIDDSDDGDIDDSDDKPNVTLITRPVTFHKASRKEFILNPSRRYIACELEVAKCDYGGAINDICEKHGHSVVDDSSLPSTGFEVNTAPASGDLFCERIRDLCDAFNEGGCYVNKSCGYHVHIDARDFNYWDIRKLIKVYGKIELALYSVVSHSRSSSDYCLSCARSYLREFNFTSKKIKNEFARAVYGGRDSQMLRIRKHERRPNARYNGLNLHSWLYRGSVESRLHQGTTNAKKVILWGILWAGILDWTYTHTEKDISKLPGTDLNLLSGPSFEALLAMSPTDKVREYLEARKKHFMNYDEDPENY